MRAPQMQWTTDSRSGCHARFQQTVGRDVQERASRLPLTGFNEPPPRRRSHTLPPKLSFGSWAFSFGPFENSPWDFARLCGYAAEAGYDGVEINGFRPHPYFRDFTGAADFRELIALRDDLGLEYSGYAPDFHDVPPGVVGEAQYLEAFEASLRFCDHLEIPILRVDTVSSPAEMSASMYEERFAGVARTWNRAAELAHEASVRLVWEFEPGFWLNRPSEVVRLLEAVNHPNFTVLFDTSHAYTGAVSGGRQGHDPELLAGGVEEYARLLEPHLGHLHLIDSDGSLHDDETSEHLPFGAGSVDFRAALRALQPSLDNLPWWTVDFCFCPTTERDARTAVPFVRELMAELASPRKAGE
jgi:sugar phosphate isomerase/epimerase